MRAIVKSVIHVKFIGIIVHFLEEVLERGVSGKGGSAAVTEELLCVPETIPLLFEQVSEILRQREGSVVSARQHHAVEKLIYRENVSLVQVCRGAFDLRCLP